MPTAFRAELPVAHFRLPEPAEKLRSLRDPHILGLPQGEGIHRRRRPGSAGTAMAVAHRLGPACHRDLHGPAEAGPGMYVGHVVPLCLPFISSLLDSASAGGHGVVHHGQVRIQSPYGRQAADVSLYPSPYTQVPIPKSLYPSPCRRVPRVSTKVRGTWMPPPSR